MSALASNCPLCEGTNVSHFHEGSRGVYYRCISCALVFLDPAQWPSLDAEIARYEMHDNDIDDAGYTEFLSRLVEPVIARVPVGARGLDYGAGESDALAILLTREGRPTLAYDPVFRPSGTALTEGYDFVVCSEVLEHAHEPRALLARLGRLVRRGGVIGIMTGMYDAVGSFGDWWYIRDSTHVCFYSRATMEWIARELGWEAEFPAPNVTIFVTPAEKGDSRQVTQG